MKTNDIMESLKMESIWRSNKPIPLSLLNEIEEGLNERDKAIELLRAIVSAAKEYEETAKPIVEAHWWMLDNVEDYQ